MPTDVARSVLDAIDDTLILQAHDPVLAARMSRAGLGCREFIHAFDTAQAGHPVGYVAFLDSLTTARKATVRHRRNRVARRARRHNRRV